MSVNQNHKDFADILREKIKSKDAEFQYLVGKCYYWGNGGIEQNHTESIKWFKLAAKQEHDDAQSYLGIMLYDGEGINKNVEEAFNWHERSANQGNAFSQNSLANFYYNGEVVSQDYDKAFELYALASNQEYWAAFYNLGDMYYDGESVEQNFEKARDCYKQALAKANIRSDTWEVCTSAEKKLIQNKIDEINQKLEDEKRVEAAIETKRNEVFVSYSHKDKEYKEELEPFLKMLENTADNEIRWWNDTHIKSGEQWREEIKAALSKAKVAVLMISANFFASEFIIKEELPDILKAADEEGTTILWVLVRTCPYKGTAIEKYQAIGDPKNPLAKLKDEEDRNEVYTKVVDRIKEIFDTQPKSAS